MQTCLVTNLAPRVNRPFVADPCPMRSAITAVLQSSIAWPNFSSMMMRCTTDQVEQDSKLRLNRDVGETHPPCSARAAAGTEIRHPHKTNDSIQDDLGSVSCLRAEA